MMVPRQLVSHDTSPIIYAPLVVNTSQSFPHSQLIWLYSKYKYIWRVWRYQRGNQNPYIEEEQTTQWPKEKVQKDKQRSTKHTYKTKDRRSNVFTLYIYNPQVYWTVWGVVPYKLEPFLCAVPVVNLWLSLSIFCVVPRTITGTPLSCFLYLTIDLRSLCLGLPFL
jgi:hypothetical protein